MDCKALAERILTRHWGIRPMTAIDYESVQSLAAALSSENVTVRNTNGVPVTVYVSVGKYDDGSMLAVAECVDAKTDDSVCVRDVFDNTNTHRCKATIYVPPVVVPEVEGEVSG